MMVAQIGINARRKKILALVNRTLSPILVYLLIDPVLLLVPYLSIAVGILTSRLWLGLFTRRCPGRQSKENNLAAYHYRESIYGKA